MDGGASPAERSRLIAAFAPVSNNHPNLVGSAGEVDILISTDVLSEGQNLQDCGVLVNYDLHWNPTRMVQRAGRIDRIGSKHPTLWVHNMFPEAGLERLLRLVESLNRKIIDIDRTGFLDASVLGETVHPRNFNTLRRIMDEDGTVIDEQEQFAELASNEFLLLQLRTLLEAGGREMLETLPDGIHSGLARQRERGLFFYFTAQRRDGEGREHFWRYYDLDLDRVLDNRFLIANLIACSSDTPRVVGDSDVFVIQDKVIDDILSSVQERQAVEAAPRILDPLQQTVITLLRGHLNSQSTDRAAVRQAMRLLGSPMTHTAIRDLRRAHELFQRGQDVQLLIAKYYRAVLSKHTVVRLLRTDSLLFPVRTFASSVSISFVVDPNTAQRKSATLWPYPLDQGIPKSARISRHWPESAYRCFLPLHDQKRSASSQHFYARIRAVQRGLTEAG